MAFQWIGAALVLRRIPRRFGPWEEASVPPSTSLQATIADCEASDRRETGGSVTGSLMDHAQQSLESGSA
jgi:hypothetical protein